MANEFYSSGGYVMKVKDFCATIFSRYNLFKKLNTLGLRYARKCPVLRPYYPHDGGAVQQAGSKIVMFLFEPDKSTMALAEFQDCNSQCVS